MASKAARDGTNDDAPAGWWQRIGVCSGQWASAAQTPERNRGVIPSRFMVRPLLVAAWILTAAVASAHPGTAADIAALTQKLAERPGDVDLLLQRAEAHRRQGQIDPALRDLKEAARHAPMRREIYLERGLVRMAQGKPGLAEADLTRYLDAGAPSAAALAARGRIREADKRWAQARADYDAALKLGADVELYLGRGRADEALGQLARAAAGYEEGLKALGGAVTLRLPLVRVEMARGRHDRALAIVEEALAAAPVRAEWLLRRAEIHAAAGRAEAAESDRVAALHEAEAQLDRRPNDLARLVRARALLALGRAAEAAPEFERIVKSSPRLTEAKPLLAQARQSTATPTKKR